MRFTDDWSRVTAALDECDIKLAPDIIAGLYEHVQAHGLTGGFRLSTAITLHLDSLRPSETPEPRAPIFAHRVP